ncbi:MAG: hypothetical protein PHX87_00225 [Candidatus Peribacteraceae bacterium]|nr:hypothetical protein [Candidatus Peribacteraceae bacterium]MDD5741834.1 hypothetical protein [Candidatus Peribacteraceae bacterium]
MRAVQHLLPYLLFSLFIVFAVSLILPYSMDEFSQFSPITCLYYPNNKLNIFREACGKYDLTLSLPFLGQWILPLRAFYYVGSLQALAYFPLFLLWESPLSARFLGMIWLIAEAHVLSLLFPGVRRKWMFLGLIGFFFYFLMHVVDRGPIGPHFFLIYLSYWLLCEWITTLQLRYILWLSFITVLGLWLKPTYAGPLVGVLIVGFVHFSKHFGTLFASKQSAAKFFIQLTAGVLAFGFFAAPIFLARINGGPAYYSIFREGGWMPLADVLQGKIFAGHSWGMLWNMWHANALGRWEPVPHPTMLSILYTLVTLLCIPGLMLGLVVSRKLAFRQMVEPVAFFVIFLVVLGSVLLSTTAWAVHHLILAFPFLILSGVSLFDVCRHALQRVWKGWYVAGCAVLLVNILAFATYFRQPIRTDDSFSRQSIHQILYDKHLSSTYLYVLVDFGMYYYQGLYGNRDQAVLFILPLDKQEQISQLKEIAAAHHRKLLFVHQTGWSTTDKALITSSFDLQRCAAVPENFSWQILLEKDKSGDSPCRSAAASAPAERTLSTILW